VPAGAQLATKPLQCTTRRTRSLQQNSQCATQTHNGGNHRASCHFPLRAAPASNDALEVQSACDASAGVLITGDVFVIASDEDNVLRFYARASPGLPIAERGPSEFVGGGGLKTDIEAAAQRGGAGSLASGSSCRYTRPAVF
jgi:hypothetical protein